jgi:hypothetical protein
MPRSKGRKRKQTSSTSPTPLQSGWLSSVCSFLKILGQKIATLANSTWAVIGYCSVLVGLVTGYLFLWPPRLTVDSPGAFDALDPLSASFITRNVWVLPLENVEIGFNPCNFYITARINIVGDCAHPDSVNARAPSWKPHYLTINEPFTVVLGELWNVPATSFSGGNIIAIVTYRVPFVPYTFTQLFRFVAERQRDGKFHWTAQSVN